MNAIGGKVHSERVTLYERIGGGKTFREVHDVCTQKSQNAFKKIHDVWMTWRKGVFPSLVLLCADTCLGIKGGEWKGDLFLIWDGTFWSVCLSVRVRAVAFRV